MDSRQLCWCLLALGAACAPAENVNPIALVELERLAFLDSTRAFVGERDFVVREPLLIDRYEITRAEFMRHLGPRYAEEGPLAEHMRDWTPETGTWPAGFMTRFEAADFAATRGMRLPTVAEWIVGAVGQRRSPFPWGAIPQESVANTLDLGFPSPRPTPVGTFEGGRTPTGCFDMLGNVWEWCGDELSVPASGVELGSQSSTPLEGARNPGRYGMGAAMGGSYLTHARPIPSDSAIHAGFFARGIDPRGRYEDVGLRCVAPARQWLSTRLGNFRIDADVRARLLAVGQRWGSSARPLLRELVKRPHVQGLAVDVLGVLLEGATLEE